MKLKTNSRKILYFFLAVFFVFLWFRLVDVKAALQLIREANWLLVIIAVLFGFVSSFLIVLRLKTLLSVVGDIPLSYLWPVSYASSLISLIFSFSIGGFALAYFIAWKMKISYRKALTILFVDFLMGIFLTFFFALLGLFYFAQKKLLSIKLKSLNQFFWPLLLLGGVLGALWLFKKKPKLAKNLSIKIKRTLALLSLKPIWGKIILLTLSMALVGLVSTYLFFIAFDMFPPLIDFYLAHALLGVLNLIPGAPAKIGQYETFGVLTLPYLLDLEKNRIFALLFLQHALSISTVLVLGWLSFYILKIDLDLLAKIKKKKS